MGDAKMKITHNRSEGQKKHATRTNLSAEIENHVRALKEVSKVTVGRVKTKWGSGGSLDLEFCRAENQVGSIIMRVTHGYVKIHYVVYTNDPEATMSAAKKFFAEKILGKKERESWIRKNQHRDLKGLMQSLSIPGVSLPQGIMAV
jgi:hypothetical protein